MAVFMAGAGFAGCSQCRRACNLGRMPEARMGFHLLSIRGDNPDDKRYAFCLQKLTRS